MASPGPTRAELLEALRQSAAAVEQGVQRLPAETLEAGRYENGWNGRQILAHIASIEWTYPRLIALAGQQQLVTGDRPAATARGGIDDYNARQVEQRAGAPADRLLDEFRRNRAALIEAVAATSDAVLARPIRSAGGISGTLAEVLQAVAVQHVLGHLHDIQGSR